MSASVANRCTRIASRSPYGIGWRTSPTRSPAASSSSPIRRLVWLLPQPVRTAVTATTGFVASSIVERGPRSRKSAPAASAIDALCITSSCARSEYARTTSSTASEPISSASRSSGTIGIPSG